jgi:hypothetical protein
MNEETFDIREVLARRKYPETSVKVWLDEEVWFEIDAVKAEHSNTTDKDRLAELDAQLDKLEKRRLDEAFTVHIRAISNRASEDIISAALAQYPIKRDLYGRDNDEQARNRNNLITEMSFAQRITKIVSPSGQAQVLTEENRREVVRSFLDQAPAFSIEIVDQAVGALAKKFNADEAEAQSPDF